MLATSENTVSIINKTSFHNPQTSQQVTYVNEACTPRKKTNRPPFSGNTLYLYSTKSYPQAQEEYQRIQIKYSRSFFLKNAYFSAFQTKKSYFDLVGQKTS